ncbi:MAG: hypothetical protein IIY42_07855 [Ruminococcus sp.]|mgnify:CR=1 FL=1|nr:hypothetical protein [Ruminococcus sp.]MBQ5687149.1 hypothetical protein [Ruminococcus sp.]
MLNLREALDYLGIDAEDDMIINNINRQIEVADRHLKAAVGDDYPADDPRMKEVALMIVGELYDKRTLSAKEENRINSLARLYMRQIRLEMEE